LARQLVLTIDSPVWPAVRRAAPWHAAKIDSETREATA